MILNAQRMNGGNPVDVRSTLYDANGSRFFNAQDEQLSVMHRELQAMPRFGQSVMLQTQWGSGLDPRVLEQRMDERVTLENRRRQAWEEVEWFIYRYREHFNAIVDNENNNWDFYNGYQWDSTELNRIQAAKLIPHVSNYMARWARTLIGEERGAETVYNFQPNDDALRLIADLYNQVIPKICQANEWPDRSSQSFGNLSIGGRCMSSVRPDPYDPYRKISLQAERPQEFMYDFENAKDGTLDGCNYLSRHYYIDLEELLHRYPEWSDYLIRYDFAQFAQTENLLRFTVAEPKVAPTAHKRMIQTPSTFIRRPFYQGRRIAWVTEFYRRGALKQWCVRDCNYNIDHDFDYNAPDQAAWFYRNLRRRKYCAEHSRDGTTGTRSDHRAYRDHARSCRSRILVWGCPARCRDRSHRPLPGGCDAQRIQSRRVARILPGRQEQPADPQSHADLLGHATWRCQRQDVLPSITLPEGIENDRSRRVGARSEQSPDRQLEYRASVR
jgi:hypothetical protein